MKRPKYVSDEHLEYLDDLRESGKTNMMYTGYYLVGEFNLSDAEAALIAFYWMKTFGNEDR